MRLGAHSTTRVVDWEEQFSVCLLRNDGRPYISVPDDDGVQTVAATPGAVRAAACASAGIGASVLHCAQRSSRLAPHTTALQRGLHGERAASAVPASSSSAANARLTAACMCADLHDLR